MGLSSTSRVLMYTSGLSFLASCGDLPTFKVGVKSDYAIQNTQPTDFPKLDLLFVVDNSNSMAEEQENLASSFDAFIGPFADRHFDFHIGVISTDTTSGSMPGWWSGKTKIKAECTPAYAGIFNGGPGTLLSKDERYKFLTPQVPGYVEKFKSNVRLGVCGSAAETGVLSAFDFFAPGKLASGGYNESFLRPDAYLSVVFLSDEDESVSAADERYVKQSPKLMADRIENFARRFLGLKPGHPELLRVDAIVAPSDAECTTVYNNENVSGVGEVYMQLAQSFHGQVSNVCKNFSSRLVNIGSQILTFLTRFPLLQPPVDADVEVRVNGKIVSKGEDDGWVLLHENEKYFVEFRGTKIPANGDRIKISYLPAKPTN